MFESKIAPDQRVKLSGFNNLTKILSFNLYDFCIALNEEQRAEYVKYIHDKYSAKKIEKIAERIVEIIEANILAVYCQLNEFSNPLGIAEFYTCFWLKYCR